MVEIPKILVKKMSKLEERTYDLGEGCLVLDSAKGLITRIIDSGEYTENEGKAMDIVIRRCKKIVKKDAETPGEDGAFCVDQYGERIDIRMR